MVKHALLALLLTLLGLVSARAAEFTAEVDRRDVALQEHVVLTLSLVNSDTRLRAQGVSPNIDLSVLTRDFDVGTPTVDNDYNIYRGRGRSTSKLRVDLFPRRTGRLRIPAFTVDGLHTAAITIEAHGLPPGVMPEVFSRAGVSHATVWQREQVVAWLDVYHRVQLKSASIGEYLSTEPTAIELLEHQDLPQSERREKIKGADYGVTRIAWALFPKRSGTLTVYLPDVWLVTADGRKLRLPHQREAIQVKPLPAAVSEDIPVGRPSLSQTTPTPAPSVNNLSTWTVTVRGPFSRFTLPDTLPLPPADGVKLYSDRGRRDDEPATAGLTTAMTYTLSALPQRSGDFSLPAVRIPYFDTERGVLTVAELPGTHLSVAAGTAGAMPAKADADQAPAPEIPAAVTTQWRSLALAFAVLWVLTLLRLRRRTAALPPQSPSPPPRQSPPPDHHHPLQARLLAAFGSRTLEQGLREWEARNGVHAPLRDTVRAVQRRCYGRARDEDENALQHAVEQAVTVIRSGSHRPGTGDNDPWQPGSFAAAAKGTHR
jgi:hypothetical protein